MFNHVTPTTIFAVYKIGYFDQDVGRSSFRSQVKPRETARLVVNLCSALDRISRYVTKPQSRRVPSTTDLNRAVSQSPVRRHIRISFKGFRFASLRGTRHNWSAAAVSATGRHCSRPVWSQPYWRRTVLYVFGYVGLVYCLWKLVLSDEQLNKTNAFIVIIMLTAKFTAI